MLMLSYQQSQFPVAGSLSSLTDKGLARTSRNYEYLSPVPNTTI